MSLNPRYELRDGVMVVKPPEPPQSYRMTMRHRDGDAELDLFGRRITCLALDDSNSLDFQRCQWEAQGYRLVRLEPVAPELAS
jgi:hypothetical protein